MSGPYSAEAPRMTTPDTRDWSYHTERFRHAETHLAEFPFLVDNNRIIHRARALRDQTSQI